MSSQVRVGIIGCGAIAEEAHLPGYRLCPEVKVTAVCDVDRARAAHLAEKAGGAKIYTSHTELLADPEVDAVSICTPNYLHATQAIDAMRAGKAVLCEKPMATSREDARAMQEVARQTGALLMVGFTHRFFRANRYLKKLIDSGEIGRVLTMRVRMAHHGPYDSWSARSDWFFRHEMAGGGAVLDMGIHSLDIMRYLAGEITEVMGMTATQVHPIADEDVALALVRFESNALGYIETGWHSPPGFAGIEVYGSEGTAVHDYSAGLRIRGFDGADRPVDTRELEGVNAHSLEVRHFIDCVLGGTTPEVGAVDGYKSVDLALRLYGR